MNDLSIETKDFPTFDSHEDLRITAGLNRDAINELAVPDTPFDVLEETIFGLVPEYVQLLTSKAKSLWFYAGLVHENGVV